MTHNVSISYQRVECWDSHALHVSISNSAAGKFDDIKQLNKPGEQSKVRQSHPQQLSSQKELDSPNWAARSPQRASAEININSIVHHFSFILWFFTSVWNSLSVLSVSVEDEVIIEDDERELERVLDFLLTLSANSRLLQALKTLPCLFCRWISNEGWKPLWQGRYESFPLSLKINLKEGFYGRWYKHGIFHTLFLYSKNWINLKTLKAHYFI